MKIILTGNPLSNQSIYRATCLGGFARYYMTKAGKDRKEDYRKEIEKQYEGRLFDIIEEDINITAYLYFGDKRRRDVDNFGKLWLDALQGTIIKDDNQVQELTTIKKYDKENPRIEIELFDY